MSNVETTVTHIGAQPPAAGHNTATGSASVPKETTATGSATGSATSSATGPTKFAKDQLRSVVDRIETIEEEKKTLGGDIRDIYTEAKGNGYDVKALRTIVRLRKLSTADRQEQETILETYMQALGML
jgi:uncharacterized protein (UPF0335 family)